MILPEVAGLRVHFSHSTDHGLRGAFREGKCGWGHRDTDVHADDVSCMQVLEFEDQGRSHLLPPGDQQHSIGAADFLLNDHTWREQFDPALPYLPFFGIWIQFHQGIEELGTEVLILQSQSVRRLIP